MSVSRRWALIRIVLGLAQMTVAAAAILLLVKQGITPAALVAAVLACVLTSVSVMLFGGWRTKR